MARNSRNSVKCLSKIEKHLRTEIVTLCFILGLLSTFLTSCATTASPFEIPDNKKFVLSLTVNTALTDGSSSLPPFEISARFQVAPHHEIELGFLPLVLYNQLSVGYSYHLRLADVAVTPSVYLTSFSWLHDASGMVTDYSLNLGNSVSYLGPSGNAVFSSITYKVTSLNKNDRPTPTPIDLSLGYYYQNEFIALLDQIYFQDLRKWYNRATVAGFL